MTPTPWVPISEPSVSAGSSSTLTLRPRIERAMRSAALLLPILVVGCGPSPPSPAPTSGLPLNWDTIFRESMGPTSVAVSADGDLLAVGASGREGTRFRIQETGRGGSEAETLGRSDWIPGSSPAFAPDRDAIAWLRGGALHVALLVHVAGEAPTLRDERVLVEGLEGIRAPRWSPDGSSLAVYASRGGSQNIWVIDVEGGELRRLTENAAEADDVRFAPQWSPDGRWIAYVSNEADWWHDDVWIVEVDTGRRHRVSSSLMASSSPIWAPSSGASRGRLVLMGTSKSGYWYQDLADLFRIDLDLAGAEPRGVSEGTIEMQVLATDYIMRFDPIVSDDGETVFFPYHERGAFDLWSVPIHGGVATRVTHRGGAWSALDGGGGTVAFVRDAPTEGREVWTVDESGGPARKATALAPRIAGVQRPIEVSFPSFDGLYIQGFLYLPAALRSRSDGHAGMACPALVQVHGGGTNSYYQGTNGVEQVLAAHGFPVLAINYRGGSGFGRAFQDLAVEDWLNDQSKDPGAAADWIRRQSWSNGTVGIYGGSYGGMQSMSAITRTPDKFDAAVPMRGIYSEALTLPDADRLGKIFAVTGHGGFPDERPDTYAKTETLDRMDRITAPVLVMHGERDIRAPFKNFELAVERLEELGKEYEAVTYDEGHAFRDPDNLVDMYSRLEAFFAKHLGACTPR